MDIINCSRIIFKGSFVSFKLPFSPFLCFRNKKIKPFPINSTIQKYLKKDYKSIHIKNFYDINGVECWTEYNYNSILKKWWSSSPVDLINEKWEKRKSGLDVYNGKTKRLIGGWNFWNSFFMRSKDKKQYLIAKI